MPEIRIAGMFLGHSPIWPILFRILSLHASFLEHFAHAPLNLTSLPVLDRSCFNILQNSDLSDNVSHTSKIFPLSKNFISLPLYPQYLEHYVEAT